MHEQETVADVVDALNISMECEQVDTRPDGSFPEKGTSHWFVTLSHRGHEMGIYYSMGAAHTGEPDADDVMGCLASDARAGEESFEDFCSNFGYDTDSRKAYATWEACVRARDDLRALMGEDFNRLMDAEY